MTKYRIVQKNHKDNTTTIFGGRYLNLVDAIDALGSRYILQPNSSYTVEPYEEEPGDIPELIPDYDAAYNHLNTKENVQSHIFDRINRQRDAFLQLLTIAKAWNEADNWEPDWKDDMEQKFTPRLYSRKKGEYKAERPGLRYLSPAPFVFKTEQRANQFAATFTDLLKTFCGIKEGE